MVLYPNKLPESERVCSGICISMFQTKRFGVLLKTFQRFFKRKLPCTNLSFQAVTGQTYYK